MKLEKPPTTIKGSYPGLAMANHAGKARKPHVAVIVTGLNNPQQKLKTAGIYAVSNVYGI